MPIVPGLDIPKGVGALELALPQTAKHLHLADAQHDKVHIAIAINVQWVGTGGACQFKARALLLQFERAAAGAVVAIELGLVDTTGDVNLGQPVCVAVKHRHATADHEFVLALKPGLQTGGFGFFHKTRNQWACSRACPTRYRDVQQKNRQQHPSTAA